jgi:putative tricarboxylic transport membrane protein
MMLDKLLDGFLLMANVWTLVGAVLGLALGILVGAIPGLTATMAVAVLTPFTFFMDTLVGIPFLLGVYKAAIYGGSISAVLINTPGTAAAGGISSASCFGVR